jgi:hypothetical protein
VTEPDAARVQLLAEIAHWRDAVRSLGDLDTVASPDAWARLEGYLRVQLRARLSAVVQGLEVEAVALEAAVAADKTTPETRAQLLRLRDRYSQVETVVDFYGDAINTRTNAKLAAVLRGLDVIAGDGLDAVLRSLGLESPPVLVYLDKGLGASILRAGVRLWDRANPSPAAAVKLTRHNLDHPTALLHEVGHQVAYQTGWNQELAAALGTGLRAQSVELADTWASWASEIAADVYAFCSCGWAPLPALANVVDGSTDAVYRFTPGDPHPFPMVRVLFNAALCRSWFGAGPWDVLARAWLERHGPEQVPNDVGRFTKASLAALGHLVDICSRTRFQAFRGEPLARFADPLRVAPTALDAFAAQAGATLDTSSYLARHDSLRIFTYLATRGTLEPAHATAHRMRLHQWLSHLDEDVEKAA